MSLMEWRGGFPVVFNGTVATTGAVTDARGGVGAAGAPIRLGAHQIQLDESGRKGPITSKWLRIVNHDASNAIRVYFSQGHFDDNVHYVLLDAQGVGANATQSMFEGPAEVEEVWLRAETDSPAFDITAFHRRA